MRRRLSLILAVLGLVAALLALAPTAAGADDNADAGVDEDAGSEPASTPPPPPPPGAPETSSSVANEVQYRAALVALSADGAGPHTLEITASFTVDDGTDPEYTGTEDLTVNGNGFVVSSGGGTDQRFLDFSSDADLTINDLTVEGFESQSSGGAINADGVVAVNGSTFVGNTADGDGGAIDADESTTITSSTFEANDAADGDGGAIDTSDDDTDITAVDSTFIGNSADFEGGALSAQADITTVGSTFAGNEAEEGAAVGAYGSVFMTNSTVTGNTGEFDVIDGTGDETGVGDVTLVYVTIADNTVVDDEGVIDSDEDGVLTAFGTTISGTQGAGTDCEVGDFSSVVSSYSRSGDTSCGFAGTGDVENAPDPQLGGLADNGGPTPTMLPADASPLLDAIPEADCDPSVTDDQRGVSRPQDAGGDGTVGCDIGAVEVEGEAPPPPPDTGPIAAGPTFTG